MNKDGVLVRALLDANADPNFLLTDEYVLDGPDPDSLFQLAVHWGDRSVIDELIHAGSDVNKVSYREGGTSDHPLATAVKRRDTFLISSLLAAGANISQTGSGDDAGCTALSAAVELGDVHLVLELLNHRPDFHDSAALQQAWLSSPAIFTLLLQHYSHRYPRGHKGFGMPTLHARIRQGDLDMVKCLVECKVDYLGFYSRPKGMSRRDRGHTALGAAIRAHRTDGDIRLQIIRLLLGHGADPNGIVTCGAYLRRTALEVAIKTGCPATVRLLLDHGADVNHSATRGVKRTPLQKAAEVGHFSIAQCLLERGAKVNSPPAVHGGATALQLAAMGGFMGIAEVLLDNDADINAPKAKVHGRSALEAAAEHGRISMVEMLLDRGALIEPPSPGQVAEPIRLAEENGHGAVADVLRAALALLQTADTTQNSLICEDCGKSFSKKSSLTRHMDTVHSAGSATRYTCGVCAEVFSRKDTLDRHKASHDRSRPNWVTCLGCDKQFMKDYHQAHLQTANRELCRRAHAVAELPILDSQPAS
ncbi:hypothetical protein LTR85_004796 [Meristemomyces frigidus]|nr:hypothetical protein LTR85_004796 [Meristemomyces frigidus]